jgi:hypothetical protein
MRALYCAIALLLCLVPGFSQTKTPSSPLAILFRFDGPTSEAGFQEMRRELRILMAPSNVQPEWRDRATISASESFDRLVVVDFHGRCRMEAGYVLSEEDQPLGWTHVMDGEILPFADIQCDRVRASLYSAGWGSPNQHSDLTLGRALALVLAHELYHILARTTSHAQNGIAKRTLSGAELASRRLAFTRADLDLMKSPREQAPAPLVAGRDLEFVP